MVFSPFRPESPSCLRGQGCPLDRVGRVTKTLYAKGGYLAQAFRPKLLPAGALALGAFLLSHGIFSFRAESLYLTSKTATYYTRRAYSQHGEMIFNGSNTDGLP
jgi:hypothetical protein